MRNRLKPAEREDSKILVPVKKMKFEPVAVWSTRSKMASRHASEAISGKSIRNNQQENNRHPYAFSEKQISSILKRAQTKWAAGRDRHGPCRNILVLVFIENRRFLS